MADLTQADHTFISHQLLTHQGTLEGTPYACAGALSGTITIKVANVETIANATGVGVLVMGSHAASGDDAWFDLTPPFIGTTVVAETEAMTATEPVGETVLACASTTNFAVLDTVYVQDSGVLANSEWHRVVRIVANVSVDIAYGLANEKDNADILWTKAEIFTVHLPDLGGLRRVNILVVHESGTGSNLHVLAAGVFATDIE